MAHLIDVVYERADRLEEAAELGAPAKPRQVSFFRVPLDANDVLGRFVAAARNLVALAMLRGVERRGRAAIRLLERLRSLRVDALADVLDDHLSSF
jgi:hypothetical protein